MWRKGDIIQGRVLELFGQNTVRIDLEGEVVIARLEGDVNEYDAYEVTQSAPQLRLKSLNMFFEARWHELAPENRMAEQARQALIDYDLPPRPDYSEVLSRFPKERWPSLLESLSALPSRLTGVGPILGAVSKEQPK